MSKIMNFEKYKDEILKIVNTGDNIAEKRRQNNWLQKNTMPSLRV